MKYSTISFQTNDPKAPHTSFVVNVPRILGIGFQPGAVSLGTISTGSSSVHEIDIVNIGNFPVEIRSIETSDPMQFEATLIPGGKPAGFNPHQGTFLGKIRVVTVTSRPRVIDGTVTVRLVKEDSTPFTATLPVRGLITAPIVLSPSTLSFPRSSESGNIYSGSALCRSHDGKPFELILPQDDQEITLRVESPPENPGNKILHVEYRGRRDFRGERTLQLYAKQGDERFPLTLTVRIQR